MADLILVLTISNNGSRGLGDYSFAIKNAYFLRNALIKNGMYPEVAVVVNQHGYELVREHRLNEAYGIPVHLPETVISQVKQGANIRLMLIGPNYPDNMMKAIDANLPAEHDDIPTYCMTEYNCTFKSKESFEKSGFRKLFMREVFETGFGEGHAGILPIFELNVANHHDIDKAKSHFWEQIDPALKETMVRGLNFQSFSDFEKEHDLTVQYAHGNHYDVIGLEKKQSSFERFLITYFAALANIDIKKHQHIILVGDQSPVSFTFTELGNPELDEFKSKEDFIIDNLACYIQKAGFSTIHIQNFVTGRRTSKQSPDAQGDARGEVTFYLLESLPSQSMRALIALSAHMVGTTGDQTLVEALSAQKIVTYECLKHKRSLFKALIKELSYQIEHLTINDCCGELSIAEIKICLKEQAPWIEKALLDYFKDINSITEQSLIATLKDVASKSYEDASCHDIQEGYTGFFKSILMVCLRIIHTKILDDQAFTILQNLLGLPNVLNSLSKLHGDIAKRQDINANVYPKLLQSLPQEVLCQNTKQNKPYVKLILALLADDEDKALGYVRQLANLSKCFEFFGMDSVITLAEKKGFRQVIAYIEIQVHRDNIGDLYVTAISGIPLIESTAKRCGLLINIHQETDVTALQSMDVSSLGITRAMLQHITKDFDLLQVKRELSTLAKNYFNIKLKNLMQEALKRKFFPFEMHKETFFNAIDVSTVSPIIASMLLDDDSKDIKTYYEKLLKYYLQYEVENCFDDMTVALCELDLAVARQCFQTKDLSTCHMNLLHVPMKHQHFVFKIFSELESKHQLLALLEQAFHASIHQYLEQIRDSDIGTTVLYAAARIVKADSIGALEKLVLVESLFKKPAHQIELLLYISQDEELFNEIQQQTLEFMDDFCLKFLKDHETLRKPALIKVIERSESLEEFHKVHSLRLFPSDERCFIRIPGIYEALQKFVRKHKTLTGGTQAVRLPNIRFFPDCKYKRDNTDNLMKHIKPISHNNPPRAWIP